MTSAQEILLTQVKKLVDERDALLRVLGHIEGVAMAREPRDLPGIEQSAREAIMAHSSPAVFMLPPDDTEGGEA